MLQGRTRHCTYPHISPPEKKTEAPLPATEVPVMALFQPPAKKNEGQAKIRQNEGVVLIITK